MKDLTYFNISQNNVQASVKRPYSIMKNLIIYLLLYQKLVNLNL